MTPNLNAQEVFVRGSITFYGSSLLFPPDVRRQITTLYAFVRCVDNFVDATPQQEMMFNAFYEAFKQSRAGLLSHNHIIDDFVALENTVGLDPLWIDAFFSSMKSDLSQKTYLTLTQTEAYMYGSANVIGLCMAKLLDLSSDSYPYAEMLGKAYQYVNFIRDIHEDEKLGRTYFPQEDLDRFKLPSLREADCRRFSNQFRQFIRFQIQRYRVWHAKATKGYKFIPKRYLLAIKTATDLYGWTINQIEINPFIVFKHKVKPTKMRILFTGLTNVLTL